MQNNTAFHTHFISVFAYKVCNKQQKKQKKKIKRVRGVTHSPMAAIEAKKNNAVVFLSYPKSESQHISRTLIILSSEAHHQSYHIHNF